VPIHLLAAPATAVVGETWHAWLLVLDLDGLAAAPDAMAVAVTLPSGGSGTATATATATATGLYRMDYDVAEAGDHLLVATATDAVNGDDVVPLRIAATATAIGVAGVRPDVAAVMAYLGDGTSATLDEVTDAYLAEVAAQANRCRIPLDYPVDLGQALKRRVARNLAARAVPVASLTSFEGGSTSVRVPVKDPEIRRLEAPWPRLPVA
jgi:hypothetical protein